LTRVADAIALKRANVGYRIGTFLARLLLRELGTGTQLHRTVRILAPSRISIGARCEFKEHCYLDGRSAKATSITIGNEVRVKDSVCLAAYGGEIHLGNHVLLGRLVSIFGHGGVSVGTHTMIGPGTVIVSTNHVAFRSPEPFQEQGFTREAISIGDNVWIGANVTITAGTVVAPNVVVAAGAVVSGELESWSLYGGVPAKRIRSIEERPAGLVTFQRDWGWRG
jgi:acetyltransferase-like isoleucine patch superfamily enzyme